MSARYFWRDRLRAGSQLSRNPGYGVRGDGPWFTAVKRSLLIDDYWRWWHARNGRGPTDAEMQRFTRELWEYVGRNEDKKYPVEVARFYSGGWVQTRIRKNHKVFDSYEWHVRHFIDMTRDTFLIDRFPEVVAARKEGLTRFGGCDKVNHGHERHNRPSTAQGD